MSKCLPWSALRNSTKKVVKKTLKYFPEIDDTFGAGGGLVSPPVDLSQVQNREASRGLDQPSGTRAVRPGTREIEDEKGGLGGAELETYGASVALDTKAPWTGKSRVK